VKLLSLPTFFAAAKKVGAAPHRGNANRPIRIQGKANTIKTKTAATTRPTGNEQRATPIPRQKHKKKDQNHKNNDKNQPPARPHRNKNFS
jgi:hypothetical protein